MLWSAASGLADKKLANWARHQVIVVGADDLGLEWQPQKYPAMAEAFDPASIPPARKTLAQLHAINPSAVVLAEVYFFEEDDKGYPADSPWWIKDAAGKKLQFWPGTHQMDLANPQYVQHILKRIVALHEAIGDGGGIFLDNLRFEPADKAAWQNLLKQVRQACGPAMPILVNAGWDSDDLAWVCPYVNGIMYEDSVAHTTDKDEEAFYGRIAATDRLIRGPTISINERFGKRADAQRSQRELIRTLAYTDMAFLYSDSTNGHKHSWPTLWDAPLGKPLTTPTKPQSGTLARREFSGGQVLWLPATAGGPQTVTLQHSMIDAATKAAVSNVTLQPGQGAILLNAIAAATR